ncbi:hypothetical protein FLM9_1600 [Candidatus Synechococcus spongiarum]|uniref:Uncharacterized protein n=1 Tax=Candidatus Synechococcus spongiarum TaxID=431041 RepID=A0A165AH04_9SYNE|nr:hypothetical protein FLM9_1600 [Candidatus Synechococcus spongiarum]
MQGKLAVTCRRSPIPMGWSHPERSGDQHLYLTLNILHKGAYIRRCPSLSTTEVLRISI